MQYTNFPRPSGSTYSQPLPVKGFLNRPRAEVLPSVRQYGFLNTPPPPPPAPEKSPYVGYSCTFTAEGGILISTGDDSNVLPVIAFYTMSVFELVFVIGLWPPLGGACVLMLFLLIFNMAICFGNCTTPQTVEVRPDCMIIDGKDVFWQKFMEGPWPRLEPDWSSFKPNGKGSKLSGVSSMKLSGIYGTRFIEYLTLERTDEFDRTPEVFDIHLRKAMNQLWNRPG